jgi:hypothetical protein
MPSAYSIIPQGPPETPSCRCPKPNIRAIRLHELHRFLALCGQEAPSHLRRRSRSAVSIRSRVGSDAPTLVVANLSHPRVPRYSTCDVAKIAVADVTRSSTQQITGFRASCLAFSGENLRFGCAMRSSRVFEQYLHLVELHCLARLANLRKSSLGPVALLVTPFNH